MKQQKKTHPDTCVNCGKRINKRLPHIGTVDGTGRVSNRHLLVDGKCFLGPFAKASFSK